MSIFIYKYFFAAAWRLARRLLHGGWHVFCYPPPPQGGEGGGPIMGQLFFIVKRKIVWCLMKATKLETQTQLKISRKNLVANSLRALFHTFPSPREKSDES